MVFEKTSHDFGKVKRPGTASTTYEFTNQGNGDLIIELVSGCHCSELVWPEGKTFKPGEKGEIKVTFHSDREEENGAMEKTIDVILEHTDPKTGYQVIKELKYNLVLEE